MQPILYRHEAGPHGRFLPLQRPELGKLVRLGVTQSGQHHLHQGFIIARPEHPYHYHIHMMQGRVRWRVHELGQERSGLLGPGDLWQCPQHIPYELVAEAEGFAWWWSLAPDFPIRARSQASLIPDRPLRERIPHLLGWLDHDVRMHDASAAANLRSLSDLLATALRRVCSEVGSGVAAVIPRQRLQPLWQAVVARPHLPWSLGELADLCSLSRFQLIRLMRRTYDCSPMAMVTRLRLQLAEERLIDSDDTLDVIAAAVGYSSGFALSKAFRRHTGMSPQRFRAVQTGAPRP